MSQKRKRSPDTPVSGDSSEDIFRSKAIEDRSSTFIGYFSPTLSAKQLQNAAEIKSASHKIAAWRKESKQRSIVGNKANYDVGYDDDGEQYGGKRVEKVLESMRVVGACVVARWYGGVMLGPVRFTHMEDCARAAVQDWMNHEEDERAKKRKVEQDAVDKAKLEKALAGRDQSIAVLRGLASAREQKVKKAMTEGMEALMTKEGEEEVVVSIGGAGKIESSSTPAPTAALDYSAMSLDRLRALDKARDATLAFLLKRIDKADADLKALFGSEQPP